MPTRYKLISSFAAVLIAMTVSAYADPMVYVVTDNFGTGAGNFGNVNLTNGSFGAIGSGLPEQTGGLVSGPDGSLLTLGDSGELYSINPGTGAVTAIGNTGIGSSSPPAGFPSNASAALTLGEANGTVYATDLNNNLYQINTSTGAAKFIGSTGMPGDPTQGTVNPDGSINLCDEALFAVGGKLYATFDAYALGSDGFTIAALHAAPEVWQINTATGAATEVSSTGFFISGVTDLSGALYAFQGLPNAENPLLQAAVTFDLSNGATGFLSDLDSNDGYVEGAVPDVPEPASLALVGTGLAALAMRLRRRQL